ncbi:MAG: hypothetical protein KGM97_01970 [Alphaproteobacteria bacterium]|nr:hypothetical protein [Alphaproteobacteria bacterium]MDE2629733.1 hypothetical protein [Alphaproteobacteria bacterium]
MRFWLVGLLACATVTAASIASPAISNELMRPAFGKARGYAPPDDRGGSVPSVARGQTLSVACADVGEAGAVVQVVMQIARAAGEPATGYSAVLATEQKIANGAVHVRVPDVPGLSRHTVNIRIFVTDTKGTHSCDGGRVRIV